jgi:hypothetical protein
MTNDVVVVESRTQRARLHPYQKHKAPKATASEAFAHSPPAQSPVVTKCKKYYPHGSESQVRSCEPMSTLDKH